MKLDRKRPYLISYASSIGGARLGSQQGPLVLQQSPYISALTDLGARPNWYATISDTAPAGTDKPQRVALQCQALAESVAPLAGKKFFIVLGGDHSSAIGTWSGVAQALGENAPLGLIWIDAHLDSHTPQTSHTGNIHGMPLASLLGHGDPRFTQVSFPSPKLMPENICLVGARSFEPEEEKLLKDQKIRIFYMDEVERRGLAVVMQEAQAIVTRNTVGFGISLDIDSIDPKEAPGTGVMEPGGIAANDLCDALAKVASHPGLLGAEIVEFDPQLDKDQLTEKLIFQLMIAITVGKK